MQPYIFPESYEAWKDTSQTDNPNNAQAVSAKLRQVASTNTILRILEVLRTECLTTNLEDIYQITRFRAELEAVTTPSTDPAKRARL